MSFRQPFAIGCYNTSLVILEFYYHEITNPIRYRHDTSYLSYKFFRGVDHKLQPVTFPDWLTFILGHHINPQIRFWQIGQSFGRCAESSRIPLSFASSALAASSIL